jgi:hypothetical protein
MRLVSALLGFAAALAAQTVDGLVINSVTGVGVPDVEVQLRTSAAPADRPARAASSRQEASTDAQGRFRFEALESGNYDVSCRKGGFRMRAPVSLFITAENEPLRLGVPMVPDGRVAGRVTDSTGRPVPDARVVLAGEGRELAARSGEDGAFSFDSVAPGNFTLSARAPLDWEPPSPWNGQEQVWALTFYPNASSPRAAAQIHVDAGAEVADLEVKLLVSPVRHIRGVAVNACGDPSPGLVVHLTDDGEALLVERTATTRDDGTFDLAATDGNWLLHADAGDGDAAVRIDGHDIGGIRVALAVALCHR